MSFRTLAPLTTALALIALASSPVAAQPTDAEPMRTPDGQPDISGIFTFRTLTPLQRPLELEGRESLTAEEAAAFEAEERTRLNRDLFDPESGAPSAGYQSRAEGGVLSYNEFWYERGVELTSDNRTSLVVDPPNGRIPYRPEWVEANRIRRLNLRNGFADDYTDRSLTDRCLMGSNSGPPMRPGSYNNNTQILQTPGYVRDRERAYPQYPTHSDRWDVRMAISHSGWATRVVGGKVKRLSSRRRTSPVTRHLLARPKIRILSSVFRRVDPDTVIYEFTFEDPNNFTRPWTAVIPMRRTDGPLYEYACHEGKLRPRGYPRWCSPAQHPVGALIAYSYRAPVASLSANETRIR